MKNNRKGFTIVELVIVIAVIAILASVLVPTFSGIVLKAQRSADTQVVRMLNEDMAIDLAQNDSNKHNTMYDAIQACIEMGVSPDKISAKSDYNIAWESSSGRFVLIDPLNQQVMYPQSDDTYDIYNISGKEIDYFIVTTYDNRIEEDENFKYSVYAYGNDWPAELTIHAGFDAGDVKGFEKITYTNNAERKDVIIRTNSFLTNLEINGKVGLGYDGDNVKHYGYSGVVTVNSIGSESYHEFGIVGRLTVKKGHIAIEDYSEVFCLMEIEAQSGDVQDTSFGQYANVHDGLLQADCAHQALVNKCNNDEHEYKQYVLDDENIYQLCKKCGFTLENEKACDETTALGKLENVPSSMNSTHEHSFTKSSSNGNGCVIETYTCECGLVYSKEVKTWTVTIVPFEDGMVMKDIVDVYGFAREVDIAAGKYRYSYSLKAQSIPNPVYGLRQNVNIIFNGWKIVGTDLVVTEIPAGCTGNIEVMPMFSIQKDIPVKGDFERGTK